MGSEPIVRPGPFCEAQPQAGQPPSHPIEKTPQTLPLQCLSSEPIVRPPFDCNDLTTTTPCPARLDLSAERARRAQRSRVASECSDPPLDCIKGGRGRPGEKRRRKPNSRGYRSISHIRCSNVTLLTGRAPDERAFSVKDVSSKSIGADFG
jgi:hypothetical protein